MLLYRPWFLVMSSKIIRGDCHNVADNFTLLNLWERKYKNILNLYKGIIRCIEISESTLSNYWKATISWRPHSINFSYNDILLLELFFLLMILNFVGNYLTILVEESL